MSFATNTRPVVLAVLVSLAVLSGCGGDDKKKPASQVAAKVNKEEISVHQINAVLSRAGNLSQDQAKQASAEVLEKLIEQELLLQKAMEKKLDRDPKTMQALEASRRQIIAQAYLEQLAASVAKPAADEIKTYYAAHPELFSERRIYRLQEIVAAVPAEQRAATQDMIAKSKSLNDVASSLKNNNIKFAANVATKPAEQLPLEILPRLHQMKDGQVAAFPNPNGLLILQLVASQTMPVDLTAATPMIEQFLGNKKRSELVTKEVADLRKDAKIEYVGAFVKSESAPATAAAPTAPATPAEKPKEAAAAGAGGVSSESISKGVAGLK